MDPKSAIILLSQSEKIKAGLIWISNAVQMFTGLPEYQKQGASRAFRTFTGMILHEVHMVHRSTQDDDWAVVAGHLDMAIVMIDSGVPEESAFHLTRALSRTTDKARKAMEALTGWGLM